MSDLISEVKAALQAATPGPWMVEKTYSGWMVTQQETFEVISFAKLHEKTEKNQYLIANSPTWLQQLLDRLETAERQREEAVKALEWYGDIENWNQYANSLDIDSAALNDVGELARTTLKRIKGENG